MKIIIKDLSKFMGRGAGLMEKVGFEQFSTLLQNYIMQIVSWTPE